MLKRHLFLTGISLLLLAACSGQDYAHTRITDTAQSGSGTAFVLRNRDRTMHLTLPAPWEGKSVKEGDDLIARKGPKAAFGIAVYVPELPTGTDTAADGWQEGMLAAIRDSLASHAPDEYTWLGDEQIIFQGAPALRTTVRQPDGTTIRDTYFLHDDYLYTASLVTDDNEMETVWPDVGEALRTMRFE